MKNEKLDLIKLIKECMDDMGYGQATNFAPPILPQNPAHQSYSIDPDGYEGKMAKTNLFKMAEYATELHNMIMDNENLEPWVEEKIAVAASMLDSVKHHLEYKKISEPQKSLPVSSIPIATIGE